MKKELLNKFYEIITPHKQDLFDKIAKERTKHVAVVLENIHQEHNASAVMRTCDCFGIQELHAIEKNNQYKVQRDIARGAGRWVNLYNYNMGNHVIKDCTTKLKSKGYSLVGTSPHATKSIFDLSLDNPIALVFGTEGEGISREMESELDELIYIPMYGFTESFNISVSVAVSLQILRTRLNELNFHWKLSEEEQIELKIAWSKKILNGGNELEKHFIEMLK